MVTPDEMRPIIAQILREKAAVGRLAAQAAARLLAPQQAMLRGISTMMASMAPALRVEKELARVIEGIRVPWLDIQEALFNSDAFTRLREGWDVRQREAAAILAERGWWLSPDFPLPLLNVVVSMKVNGQSREINRLICDYYTKRRLSALVNSWMHHPLFNRRKHLLREAWRAHRDRRWTLSVPVLLAQVEGVLRDYAEEAGVSEGSVKRMARLLRADSSDSTLISETWLAQLEGIFEGYFSTKTVHKGLKRNAILHGRELRYGREVRSLQLFLQLDTIHWLIARKSEEKAA